MAKSWEKMSTDERLAYLMSELRQKDIQLVSLTLKVTEMGHAIEMLEKRLAEKD